MANHVFSSLLTTISHFDIMIYMCKYPSWFRVNQNFSALKQRWSALMFFIFCENQSWETSNHKNSVVQSWLSPGLQTTCKSPSLYWNSELFCPTHHEYSMRPKNIFNSTGLLSVGLKKKVTLKTPTKNNFEDLWNGTSITSIVRRNTLPSKNEFV